MAPPVPLDDPDDADPGGSAETVRVRRLTRYRLPLHFLIPAAAGIVGILLLLLGGTAAWIGGWWLVAGFPIAIGGFLRDPRLALVPLVVWIGWSILANTADAQAELAHTPLTLAVGLGLIGAGATAVAQRAIFPATEPAAWHLPGTGEDDEPLEVGTSDDSATTTEPEAASVARTDDEIEVDPSDAALDDALDAPFEVTDEEFDEATLAIRSDATQAAAPAVDEVRAAVQEAGGVDEALAGADAPDDSADEAAGGDADEDEAVPLESDGSTAPAETKAAAPPSLPVDADPAALDEGGHVTEFAALTVDEDED